MIIVGDISNIYRALISIHLFISNVQYEQYVVGTEFANIEYGKSMFR